MEEARRKVVEDTIKLFKERYDKDSHLRSLIDQTYSNLLESHKTGYKLSKAELNFIRAYRKYDEKMMMASFIWMMNEPTRFKKRSLVDKLGEKIKYLFGTGTTV